MLRVVSRLTAAAVVAAGLLLISSAGAPPAAPQHPDQLVILSATDLKGRVAPCGCHVPKGGVGRRWFYVDSLEKVYSQVLHVDNGSFFPDDDSRRVTAEFLMDALETLKIDALNVGELDLRYGIAFLKQSTRQRDLPVTSANLLDAKTRQPVFSPYLVKKVGGVTVGVFGLIAPDAKLGPAADSLAVGDPRQTAQRTVATLKQKGATVIVLLSQLGQRSGEELVAAVSGVDAVVLGHNVVVAQQGKVFNHAHTCYGGEQGHYLCRTDLALDAGHHVRSGSAGAVMLGPDVRDEPGLAVKSQALEDELVAHAERAFLAQQLADRPQVFETSSEHYIGAELCIRCHQPEGEAWKTTSHAQAWTTLVNVRRDSVDACVSCHVAGFMKTGGFVTTETTPGLAGVQCESCHGMGTDHDAYSKRRAMNASACTQCHGKRYDPNFDFATALPKVLHTNRSGETLKSKKVQKPGDEKNVPELMKSDGS